MRKKKQGSRLLLFVLILILVLVLLYSGLRILESTVLFSGKEEREDFVSKTIAHNGIDYFPKQDITTILVMGISENGQSEMNALLIFDESEGEYSVLHLNRDTMVQMPVLDSNGKQTDTTYGRLSEAFTYGNGREDSCENIGNTVSDFLRGINIDKYLAVQMDAIAVLNDAVGGVTVEITEDFSAVDPQIHMGMVNLTGEHTINYLSAGKDADERLNASATQRQALYMDGFMKAFQAKMAKEPGFLVAAYEQIKPYVVTDLSAIDMLEMADHFKQFNRSETVFTAGETRKSETYFEFYADEEKLDELILRLFYEPK